jgi:hypothetical protein
MLFIGSSFRMGGVGCFWLLAINQDDRAVGTVNERPGLDLFLAKKPTDMVTE